MTDERMTFYPNGALDEVVLDGVTAHIEQLDGNAYFMSLTKPDGSSLALWFGSSRKITVSQEIRPPRKQLRKRAKSQISAALAGR